MEVLNDEESTPSGKDAIPILAIDGSGEMPNELPLGCTLRVPSVVGVGSRFWEEGCIVDIGGVICSGKEERSGVGIAPTPEPCCLCLE